MPGETAGKELVLTGITHERGKMLKLINLKLEHLDETKDLAHELQSDPLPARELSSPANDAPGGILAFRSNFFPHESAGRGLISLFSHKCILFSES